MIPAITMMSLIQVTRCKVSPIWPEIISSKLAELDSKSEVLQTTLGTTIKGLLRSSQTITQIQ